MLGDVLLGIVMVCTFLSYFPQIIKTMKTKKSGDISVESWILWVISSLAYTAYAVFSNKDLLLMLETGLELIFCLTILILTIKYKNNSENGRKTKGEL